jgi:hypothetical protein
VDLLKRQNQKKENHHEMVVFFLVGMEGLSASLLVCLRFAQRKLVSGAARPLKNADTVAFFYAAT